MKVHTLFKQCITAALCQLCHVKLQEDSLDNPSIFLKKASIVPNKPMCNFFTTKVVSV